MSFEKVEYYIVECDKCGTYFIANSTTKKELIKELCDAGWKCFGSWSHATEGDAIFCSQKCKDAY